MNERYEPRVFTGHPGAQKMQEATDVIKVRVGQEYICHRVQNPSGQRGRVTQIEQQPFAAALELHLHERIAEHAVHQPGADRPGADGERLPASGRAHGLGHFNDFRARCAHFAKPAIARENQLIATDSIAASGQMDPLQRLE